MDTPIVQILLEDRVLQEVPFRGETLRIGRMRANDIVINNLSVSRFHAALHRSAEGVELEDLGSENGCHVDGQRVRGRIPLGPGMPVRIGQHVLCWRGEADEVAGVAEAAPETGAADLAPGADAAAEESGAAADSAPTGPPVAAASPDSGAAEAPALADRPGGPADELDLELEGSELGLGGPDSEIDPVAEGLDLALAGFDEASEEPAAAPQPPAGPAAGDAAEDADAAGAPEAPRDDLSGPFERSPVLDLAGPDPEVDGAPGLEAPAPEPAPGAAPPPAADSAASPADGLTAGRHPGLIVQRGGRLERILPWEGPRLALAPGAARGLRLDADPAEARVLFVREGDAFRVRSAGPETALRVNGELVAERDLEVGDVVSVDAHEITFVLDHEPVQSEVLTSPEEDSSAAGAPVAPDPAPVGGGAEVAEGGGGDAAAPQAPLHHDILQEPEEDEEKELPVHVRAVRRGPETVASGPALPLHVELEIRPEDLPEPLRNLVDALEGGEVSVPVRLRLRAGRGEPGSGAAGA